jgi:hypothetical protein
MTLKSKLLLISRGREDSRAHRLAVAIVEYAWDRGAEVRVRRDSRARVHGWAMPGAEDRLAELTAEDLEWADVTIVLADGAQANAFEDERGYALASGPRLVS